MSSTAMVMLGNFEAYFFRGRLSQHFARLNNIYICISHPQRCEMKEGLAP